MNKFIQLDEVVMKAKVKHIQLFHIEPNEVKGLPGKLDLGKNNQSLMELLNFKAKSAALNYDIDIRLREAVVKATQEFHIQHKKLLEDCSIKKKIKFVNDNEIETFYKIVEVTEEDFKKLSMEHKKDLIIDSVDGNPIETISRLSPDNGYDIKDIDDFNKRFNELLDHEIELICYPIKISKLELEPDCSMLNFAQLKPFLKDDRNA